MGSQRIENGTLVVLSMEVNSLKMRDKRLAGGSVI